MLILIFILFFSSFVYAAESTTANNGLLKDVQILELQKELSEAKTTIMQLQAIIQSVHSDQYQIEMNKQRQFNEELKKIKEKK